MSFGPELVWIWSRAFEKCVGRRVQKVDGGDAWAALGLSGNLTLLLSWGTQNCGAAFISEKEKKELLSAAAQTPPITNALKSGIAGAELVKASQLNRDRIIRLTFKKTVGAGFSSLRSLTLETIERYSNLILADEDGCIIETAKHVHPSENRYRSILPGQKYVLPPEFNGIALEEWLKKPSIDTLRNVAGFGKPLIRALSEMTAERASEFLRYFYNARSDGVSLDSVLLPQRIGNYVTALPFVLEEAERLENVSLEDTGRIAALAPIANDATGSRRKKLNGVVAREILRRERQLEDIDRLLSQNPEKFRRYGEILVANAHQIKPGAAEAEITYWDGDGEQKRETVPLDPKIMPAKNAAAYFAKYKKIAMAQERAKKLLEKVNQELDELKEQLALIECIEDAETLDMMEDEMGLAKKTASRLGKKKQAPALPPHKRFDLGFALVFAGLSAKGNRYVTFKLANAEDVWFHAQGIPGAHVILRYNSTPTDEEREQAINFCASLAARYSKGRENAAQRVDYTLRKHVSPIKGGVANVTYKEFKSVTANGLRPCRP